MSEEFRTTVLVRIERELRDQLLAMAKPRWGFAYEGAPKEPVGAVIQRLVDERRTRTVNRPRARRRRGRAVNRRPGGRKR